MIGHRSICGCISASALAWSLVALAIEQTGDFVTIFVRNPWKAQQLTLITEPTIQFELQCSTLAFADEFDNIASVTSGQDCANECALHKDCGIAVWDEDKSICVLKHKMEPAEDDFPPPTPDPISTPWASGECSKRLDNIQRAERECEEQLDKEQQNTKRTKRECTTDLTKADEERDCAKEMDQIERRYEEGRKRAVQDERDDATRKCDAEKNRALEDEKGHLERKCALDRERLLGIERETCKQDLNHADRECTKRFQQNQDRRKDDISFNPGFQEWPESMADYNIEGVTYARSRYDFSRRLRADVLQYSPGLFRGRLGSSQVDTNGKPSGKLLHDVHGLTSPTSGGWGYRSLPEPEDDHQAGQNVMSSSRWAGPDDCVADGYAKVVGMVKMAKGEQQFPAFLIVEVLHWYRNLRG
ncbi:hypothetical protein PG996_003034 [Apiospora saccharicola]|uniref:Apple domain-containing protein n=1 Tax=Apiospora saccharicola TaxID=335842 RepID=A0ABR1W3X0_9PEZI